MCRREKLLVPAGNLTPAFQPVAIPIYHYKQGSFPRGHLSTRVLFLLSGEGYAILGKATLIAKVLAM
jgi:hypothetical protein